MKRNFFKPDLLQANSPAAERANVRVAVLVFVVFALGLLAGGYWIHRRAQTPAAAASPGENTTGLSDATKKILDSLTAPVEVHFYSLLDSASVSDSLQAYARRVDQLVQAFKDEAGSQLQVTRYDARSQNAAEAASADGVKAFNLDKGDACFLGIAVIRGDQHETLPRLAPEWEAALESDLSRAIERVAHARPATQDAFASPAAKPETVTDVKNAIPDLGSVSTEQGEQILRAAALKEFQAAAAAMQTELKAAQDAVLQAEKTGSESALQSAKEHLQQVQAEQTQKLKNIGIRLQTQIEALHQLKSE